MRINIIAIGNKIPTWVNQGIQEYKKRIPKNFNFQLISVEPKKRNKSTPINKITAEESLLLLEKSQNSNKIIALDEKGKQHTTKEFAKKITSWMQDDYKISFLIGGADGHSEELKKISNEVWSISNFTLPHSIARLLITEQTYRAISLINNHPYHRE